MRKQRRRSAVEIGAFVCATQIVQTLFFLNLRFKASGLLLSLHKSIGGWGGGGQDPFL